MRVFQCEHPKVVTNLYSGEQVVCRCGKCSACLDTRAALWVQKLDNEMQCHRYTLFVTLQYNEQNVPQVVRLRNEDLPFKCCPHDYSYIDCETSEIFGFYDKSVSRHNKADCNYVKNTKVLLTLSKRDCQLFIKRLRYFINQIAKYEHLRYFITGEYGGRTYRPHYHLLLFFDSEKVAENINELLCKSWKLGNIYDPHFVNGSASEYVASYVNSFSKLPSIYSHVGLRQFTLYSKQPAIGTLQILRQDYSKIFFEKLNKIRLFKGDIHEFVDVPLWRSIQDRLFPRIPSFNSLSCEDRVRMYEFGNRFPQAESSEVFARWLSIYYAKGSSHDSVEKRYFEKISKKPVVSYDLLGNKTISYRFCDNSLLNFARIVRRVAIQAQSFNISIREYVNNISDFYDELQKSRYYEQLNFQDEYFKKHPDESHALFFDYAFIDRVNGKLFSSLSPSDKYYLKCNMLADDSTDIVRLSLDDCFDYKDMVTLHNKINHENCKTKDMNDYIFKQSNKFQNIIGYLKDLKDLNYA